MFDFAAAEADVELGSKNHVFGVSLSKCLRHDAERHGRQMPVSPSCQSSLVDALSLQFVNSSRLILTPRLSTQQLYDERYCSMLLHVPQIMRTCCHHLKIHGIVVYTIISAHLHLYQAVSIESRHRALTQIMVV